MKTFQFKNVRGNFQLVDNAISRCCLYLYQSAHPWSRSCWRSSCSHSSWTCCSRRRRSVLLVSCGTCNTRTRTPKLRKPYRCRRKWRWTHRQCFELRYRPIDPEIAMKFNPLNEWNLTNLNVPRASRTFLRRRPSSTTSLSTFPDGVCSGGWECWN